MSTHNRLKNPLLLATVLFGLVLIVAPVIAQDPAQAEGESTAAPEETGQEAPALPEATPPPPGTPEPPQFLVGTSRTLADFANDVFYWGQSATVTGTLGDNAFLGGQMVSVDGGAIEGDLFAFGASIAIAGEVMGDVYAFGSEVRVAQDAVIHGTLMSFSGSLRIAGTVHGHVNGTGGGTVISGTTGPVKIEAGSLTLTETAVIRGDLEYTANEEAEIAEEADIQGNVRWNRDEDDDEDDEDDEESSDSGGIGFWSIGWMLWRFLSALIVGSVLLLVGGRVARQPATSLDAAPASGLGFGFVVAVVFPVACLVALVLIVTIPLGVLGLLTFGLLLYIARLVAAQFVGRWILARATGNENPSEYASLALGLLVLIVVGLVPYLGFLLRMAAVIIGLGGIYLALRHFGFPSSGSTPPPPPAAAAAARAEAA